MAKTTQRTWLTPLSIPEDKVGGYEIKHMIIPAGQKVMLNNFRNQLFGSQKGVNSLIYDIATPWHKLIGPQGVWMTDLPVEQRQMEECLKGMKGRILIGGLGLGLAATLLAKRKSITHIDVIEISPEVIQLVGPHTRSRWNPKGKYRGWVINIIQDDLLKYLANYNGDPYDYAFFDIWQSDNEETFFAIVMPLLQLSKGKIKHLPVCWQENVMRRQLLQSIQTRLLLLKPAVQGQIFPETARAYIRDHPPWQMNDDHRWHNWAVPFFQWWKDQQALTDEEIDAAASRYTSLYGTWDWEQQWRR